MKKKWMKCVSVTLMAVITMLSGCGLKEQMVNDVQQAMAEQTEESVGKLQQMATDKVHQEFNEFTQGILQKVQEKREPSFDLASIPVFSDTPYVVLNNNEPKFKKSEITTTAYEEYSELDVLGRCGVAEACVGVELMPTEERGSIGSVKPSGWHTVKYDCVDGKYLYNRCHLIGFQLTGENANEENLITGTRYMNVDGMLPFENMVADFVRETGMHVMYRVTPVFDGTNLVASGAVMEALSVEDNGAGICFNVYCYNNQPGIGINYQTGDSWIQ